MHQATPLTAYMGTAAITLSPWFAVFLLFGRIGLATLFIACVICLLLGAIALVRPIKPKLFSTANRHKALRRWHTFQSARSWLSYGNDSGGDWYWTSSAEFNELRRRRLVDEFGRLTPIGRRLRATLLETLRRPVNTMTERKISCL